MKSCWTQGKQYPLLSPPWREQIVSPVEKKNLYQAQSTLCKPTLSTGSQYHVPPVPENGFQEHFLCFLPRRWNLEISIFSHVLCWSSISQKGVDNNCHLFVIRKACQLIIQKSWFPSINEHLKKIHSTAMRSWNFMPDYHYHAF